MVIALCRRPARKRRKYRTYALSRSATFGPGLALPLWGWLQLGEPLHWAGLAVMAVAGLLVIPAAVVVTVFFLPAMLTGGLVPRKWRISHRRRHGRDACRSSYISTGLRRVTYAADRNRCLYCRITSAELAAAGESLQVDHYRPWAAGGLTTLLNSSAMCPRDNGVKLNYWRERSGYIWYRPEARTPERLALAADITRALKWRRWNPLRLLRAAWALG